MLQKIYTKRQFFIREILYIGVERLKIGERKMGYGLFTARKTSLQSNINSLNSKLMQLQNKKTSLTNQIANEQNMYNMQSAYNQQQYTSVFSNSLQIGMDYSQAMVNYQNSMAQNTLSSTQNNFKVNSLKNEDNALDSQISQIQTQLNAQSQELENVKKAEESGIKNSTVKYVG